MNAFPDTLPRPLVSAAVQGFANSKGIGGWLNAVIDLAQQAFPTASLSISVGQDAEDQSHQYVAIDVDAGSQSAEELLTGQRAWSTGIGRICPAPNAVYFVLGWR